MALRAHLRRLADAYTLYAFLQQTPDVQRALVSMFQGGELWLDTTVVLPILAETLLDDLDARGVTNLLQAARDAGVRLYVTDGVIEETERHIHRSVVCSRTALSRWTARLPFLFKAYSETGGSRGGFPSWIERFVGPEEPVQDIQDFLEGQFGIRLRDISAEADEAPPDVRGVAERLWSIAHERRRASGRDELDDITVQRLIRHDVINAVGVMQLRRGQSATPMGYRHWYLTLDRTAFRLASELRNEFGDRGPRSPVMSPDFLTDYLRLGRIRSEVEREHSASLPLLADISKQDLLADSIIEVADQIRQESAELDDHVVARRIRDQLNARRVASGAEALHSSEVEKQILESAADQRRRSGP